MNTGKIPAYKTGFILRPSGNVPTRTVVVFGLERGGTSPVAGIIRALGVFMGQDLDNNNEDPAFVHRPVSKIVAEIGKRNEQHGTWGWKFPKAVQELPLYIRHLRHPHFVLVSRDPVAVALGNRKWNGAAMQRNLRFSLSEAAAYNSLNMGFVLAAHAPAAVVSFEKFLNDPGDTVDMLVEFLGLPEPPGELKNQILAYVTGSGYRRFEEFFPT